MAELAVGGKRSEDHVVLTRPEGELVLRLLTWADQAQYPIGWGMALTRGEGNLKGRLEHLFGPARLPTCPRCEGSGQVGIGTFDRPVRCAQCGGLGRVRELEERG